MTQSFSSLSKWKYKASNNKKRLACKNNSITLMLPSYRPKIKYVQFRSDLYNIKRPATWSHRLSKSQCTEVIKRGINLSGERGGNMFDLCHCPYPRHDIRANCQCKAKQISPDQGKAFCWIAMKSCWQGEIPIWSVLTTPPLKLLKMGRLPLGERHLTHVLRHLGQSNHHKQWGFL